ncbi:MAG TPA: Hsp20/alpha crystallin family protein [Deltaproteobacteria bacterium]|nr:Hsp20/alpha crystallin family protein [Deltaproteobacteria bacterium]
MDFIKIRFNDDRNAATGDEQTGTSPTLRFFEPMFTVYRRVWRPAVDICETEDDYIVLVELAGVQEDDLSLEISNRTVRIYGNRQERLQTNRTCYHLAEITYGYFERSLTLPIPIDRDRVEAVFSGGLLEIRIPKAEPDTTVRKILVQGR